MEVCAGCSVTTGVEFEPAGTELNHIAIAQTRISAPLTVDDDAVAVAARQIGDPPIGQIFPVNRGVVNVGAAA